ncbi:MAG: hypothetical protein V1742_01845 [Pseudomonadota bacterium]
MNELQSEKAKVQKICLDTECAEAWEKIPPECAKFVREFTYCPFCSEELNLQCSRCKESLTSKDFKYCPWCGVEFGD